MAKGNIVASMLSLVSNQKGLKSIVYIAIRQYVITVCFYWWENVYNINITVGYPVLDRRVIGKITITYSCK